LKPRIHLSQPTEYLMENLEESTRLDRKTDPLIVEKQARWAGIRPGMRVADLGCGSGKTTKVLNRMVQPDGEVIGLDFAPSRHEFAERHYAGPGIRFLCRDVRDSLDDLGTFDFLWVRFLLEYYLADSVEIVAHISKYLKPGGTLCLIDLDHNSLNHYGLTERMEKTMNDLTVLFQKKADFDPWAGRKLYSFLYDLGYENIVVEVSTHHLIYGVLEEKEAFNWVKKIEVGPSKLGYDFPAYQGSISKFRKDFFEYIRNPRRFMYTPLIACRGQKPTSG
jgi:SAM-dependent methyltransferase